MSRYDAQVLADVVAGRVTARWVVEASEAQKISLATLLRLRYVEPDGPDYAPSAEVSFSLGLVRAKGSETS